MAWYIKFYKTKMYLSCAHTPLYSIMFKLIQQNKKYLDILYDR